MIRRRIHEIREHTPHRLNTTPGVFFFKPKIDHRDVPRRVVYGRVKCRLSVNACMHM